MLKVKSLIHGGVMANYQCNAACRHCNYACSPTRSPGFVDEETAEKICALLRKGGCRSVHIGGGEPFLNFEGLLMVIRKLAKAGVTLDYIETNAFWATEGAGSDLNEAKKKLEGLLKEGANTLCISIDPFHAEYVPYGAPLALAKLCERTGMNYFLWKREFLRTLSRLDSQKAHSRPDMEKALSPQYIGDTARLYGIGYGGRAVNIEGEYGSRRPADYFATEKDPCQGLLATGHFHVDMFGNFIPPHCTGIRFPLSESVAGIPDGKYPAFEALYSGGVSALLSLAQGHGFSPDPSGYTSKCNLCFHIRHFLSEEPQVKDFPELDRNYYEEALKYY
jgi:hypothetical protein